MEPSDVLYAPKEYIKTATANLISRKASIQGPQRVEMRGRVGTALYVVHSALAPAGQHRCSPILHDHEIPMIAT
jgi:hypothetical protein